jgi:hypothetical protein
MQSPNAWKKIGFNLDGKVSTRNSTDVCTDGLTLESGAKTRFDDAYIVDGTWVSGGGPNDVVLPLMIGGLTFLREFDLVIHHAVITFKHVVPGGAVVGTIAGVLNVEEAVNAAVGGAADIMSDGTNRPGVRCDGISIGVGFIAEPVASAVTVGTHTRHTSDPCGTPSWPLNWPAQ